MQKHNKQQTIEEIEPILHHNNKQITTISSAIVSIITTAVTNQISNRFQYILKVILFRFAIVALCLYI